jgi:thiamine biosynthesis lipoprotein
MNLSVKSLKMLHTSKIERRLMGSDFELVAIDPDAEKAADYLEEGVAEIKRIEQLLTVFDPASQASLINRNAAVAPVTVDKEVYLLLKRCKDLSALTQGAFDISTGALKALYNFTKEIFRMPDDSTLSHALQATGYRHMLLLDDNRVLLNRANMQIGFGAVGKGYAADKVKALLLSRGLRSGVVNASGDLTVWGRNADGHPWKVGIADPDNTGNILYWIPVENASVATSGNYEQYFEWKGTRYSTI